MIGVNPLTGTLKFSLPLPTIDDGVSAPVDSVIIAGDGYAYLARRYWRLDYCGSTCMPPFLWRMDTSGGYVAISIPNDVDPAGGMITNADQGVVLTWETYENGSYHEHMLTTAGTSVSTLGAPQVADEGGPVIPVLQAQDGSFVGTVQVGDRDSGPTQTNMVAFDASGTVRWTVPNETPQIATADGGVIAQSVNADGTIGPSATIYDQNGNATGQLATLPKYSWKGAYQVGSVESIVSKWWNLAKSYWAVVSGNLTHNGTAALHQSLTMNWCANNVCELAYAPQWGGPSVTDSNVDYYYQMAQQQNSSHPTPSVELGASQIATIRNNAQAAFEFAFRDLPARVLSSDNPQYTNMVEVSGGQYCVGPGDCPCGLTAPGKAKSTAWYPCNMTNTQWALGLAGTDLSANTGSQNFAKILWSIGEGIGNTAAHETGHQFLGNSLACGMNDDASKIGVYDGGSADGLRDPSVYTGLGPDGQPIHWSNNTAKCLSNMMLLGKTGLSQ